MQSWTWTAVATTGAEAAAVAEATMMRWRRRWEEAVVATAGAEGTAVAEAAMMRWRTWVKLSGLPGPNSL